MNRMSVKSRRLAGNRRNYFSLTVFLFRCLIYLEFINSFFFPRRNQELGFIIYLFYFKTFGGAGSLFQHAVFSSCGVRTQLPHSMWEVSVPNQGLNLRPLHWKGDSFLFLILFILGCAGSSRLHTGLLQLWRAGSTLQLWWRAFIAVTSLAVEPGLWAHRPQQLPYMSSVAASGLEHRLSSCEARGEWFCSMWDLWRPGIKLMSPALAGRFFITEPPGKSHSAFYSESLSAAILES